MLKLKPSLRTNKRYLLIRGSKEEIEKAILDYVGLVGWAKAEPTFVKKIGKNLILSINRKEINKILGSFAITENRIEVLKVSGTLKGLDKKRNANLKNTLS